MSEWSIQLTVLHVIVQSINKDLLSWELL